MNQTWQSTRSGVVIALLAFVACKGATAPKDSPSAASAQTEVTEAESESDALPANETEATGPASNAGTEPSGGATSESEPADNQDSSASSTPDANKESSVDAGANSSPSEPEQADPDAMMSGPPVADAGASTTDEIETEGPSCCTAHSGGGCEDESVRSCVCDADERCCSEQWDDVCVLLVDALGCGQCKSECCSPSGSAGCQTPEVEACVCEKAPECCSSAWDEFCVLLASSETATGSCTQECAEAR